MVKAFVNVAYINSILINDALTPILSPHHALTPKNFFSKIFLKNLSNFIIL